MASFARTAHRLGLGSVRATLLINLSWIGQTATHSQSYKGALKEAAHQSKTAQGTMDSALAFRAAAPPPGGRVEAGEIPGDRKAVDLSHHLSELAKARRFSPLKSFSRYMGIPGIISLSVIPDILCCQWNALLSDDPLDRATSDIAELTDICVTTF